MADRYEKIRKALGMGPTPGPWSVRYDYVVQAKSFDEGRLVPIAQPYGLRVDGSDLFANAAHIAGCDPDTIRAMLDERDALAAENERLKAEQVDLWRFRKGGIGLEDISLAAQMLTWGREEGLDEKQIEEIDAHATKLFALIDAHKGE